MKEKVIIKFNLINKKGIDKQVSFYVPKKIVDILEDESISMSYKNDYLKDIYYEIVNERNYKRKVINRPDITNFKDNEILFTNSKIKENELYNKAILRLKGLSKRQQEVITKVLIEGKTISSVAKELNVSKQSVSLTYKRALNNLKKLVKK